VIGITTRIVRLPAWLKGSAIDVRPLVGDALDSISRTLKTRHDSARGLGVKRNIVTVREVAQTREISSTLNFPRTVGSAMQRKNESRFRGMAPAAIRKYILEPLQKKWAA